MSAMPPAGKLAKSAASQPLVFEFAVGPGGMTRSTGTSGPVAVPSGVPESNRLRRKSVSLTNVRGSEKPGSAPEFSSK